MSTMWTTPTPSMEVLTYATEDEGIDGSGEKAWFSVDGCRWSPFSNPDCLEVRLAGSNVRVKVPLENVFTDVKGLAYAETRQWRRGFDPTKPQPPPLSPPSPPRKRESSDTDTSATKLRKPPSKKTLKAGSDKGGGKSGDKKPATGAARKSVRNATASSTMTMTKPNAKPTVAAKKMAAEEKDEQDDSHSAAYDAETGDEAEVEVDTWAGPAPKHTKRVGKQRKFYG